jgi:hypothetical protein
MLRAFIEVLGSFVAATPPSRTEGARQRAFALAIILVAFVAVAWVSLSA